jgi:phosphoribosylanthranilate isomerase
MHPKVKICGMTNAETIQTAIKHKVDYLGLSKIAKKLNTQSGKRTD